MIFYRRIILVFSICIFLIYIGRVFYLYRYGRLTRYTTTGVLEQIGNKISHESVPARTTNWEPIDIVYTWVNGSDPVHEALVLSYKRSLGSDQSLQVNRFEDWNTLRYSLRSVEQYVNWTRHIFIVTNGQIPDWLNLNNRRISIVTHEEIFPNKSHLPTFSSPAIESNIHRINGLSRYFIYSNDDFFFTTPVSLADFYTESKGYKVRLEPYELYDCSKTCAQTDVNNGVCDDPCFTERCEWDGDDCTKRERKQVKKLEGNLDGTAIWLSSMLHSTYQLNKVFGPRRRRPALHAPVFINKDILIQLHNRFQHEWDLTSSRQVRHYNNMQFQFTYVNYLLELSYQSSIKTERLMRKDCAYLKVSENVSSSALDTFRRNRKRNVKFAMLADQVHMKLAEDKKNEIRRKVDDFFTSWFPRPSTFEI